MIDRADPVSSSIRTGVPLIVGATIKAFALAGEAEVLESIVSSSSSKACVFDSGC